MAVISLKLSDAVDAQLTEQGGEGSAFHSAADLSTNPAYLPGFGTA